VEAVADLVEDGAKEAIGRMGLGAGAVAGVAEEGEVEVFDSAVKGAGEVVECEAAFDVEFVGMVVVPGQGAKACEGSVRGWVGEYDSHGGSSCGRWFHLPVIAAAFPLFVYPT
jgi:hypothetical protein